MARAVLESICYQTRDVVDAMQRDSAIPLKELRCDGGASANGFLMQYQSDILGVPVEVPEVAETTALGAAYLAGLATGYWSGRAEIDANWRLSRRYVPSLSEDQRAHLYRRWLEAVKRAKDWAREEGE
jgi:glycerol kinase